MEEKKKEKEGNPLSDEGLGVISPYLSRIQDSFKKKNEDEMDVIFDIVNLLIYSSTRSSDLLAIYKLLDLDDFVKLCSIVDGRTIRLPSKEDIQDALLGALFYYEKEVEGLSWEDIRKKYPEWDISSIKFALQRKRLNEFMKQKLSEYFSKLK